MPKREIILLVYNKKADTDLTTKHLIYWILILVFVVIIWFIVNGIIHKLLTLY